MAKRGQSGVEYMVVLAFALAIFVPLLYLLFSSYSGYSAETAQAQAAQMVREIVATSERVWHHGPPTRLTFEMRVPDRISNVTIRRNNPGSGCTECTELVIFMQDGGSASASTFVDIRGATEAAQAPIQARKIIDGGITYYFFDVDGSGGFLGQGARKFRLEMIAEGGEQYVLLRSV